MRNEDTSMRIDKETAHQIKLLAVTNRLTMGQCMKVMINQINAEHLGVLSPMEIDRVIKR